MSIDALPSPADIFAPELPDVPYPGLRPFEKHEWPLFFGRERATQEVTELLLEHGLVVVHGSSGCGKSSLIRAGVLSRLEQEHARSGLAWYTCAMRPGNAPTRNLASALACLGGTQADAERVQKLRRLIARGAKAISELAKAIAAGPERRVCLLVDQFEELFRFARETNREQATLLAGFLVGLAETRSSGLYAIVTMRSEFLGHCAQFSGLAETFNRSQYLLPPMERTALLQAIREPAILYGGEVARPLAERLIVDAGGEQDTLPLIQHGLMRLWRQAIEIDPAPAAPEPEPWPFLDLAAYERAGNLANLLSSHADSVLTEAAPDERRHKIVEHAFLALTDIDAEGNVTRRPRCFRELRTISRAADDELQAVLAPFRASDASFLTPVGLEPIAEDDTVDISHEALIREWTQLKDWTKAKRDALRRREHIKSRMHPWEEQGRDKTLLLPPGLPLEEGKKLLADTRGVFIEDVQPYIEESLKRDRRRITFRALLVGSIIVATTFIFTQEIYLDKLRQKSRQTWGTLHHKLETHINSPEANDKAPPPRLEQIKTLLSETIRFLPKIEADSAFDEITKLCTKDNVGRWCLETLTAIWAKRSDSFWIPFRLATEWMHRSRDGADQALKLLNQAALNLHGEEEHRQQELEAWLTYARGIAHQTRARHGVEGEYEEAVRHFAELTEQKLQGKGPGVDLVYAALARAMAEKRDLNAAWNSINRGKAFVTSELSRQELWLLWSEGRFAEALDHVKGKSDHDSLFTRSVIRMVANGKDAENMEADVIEYLGGEHANRDYVRLIYYWTLMRHGAADRARELLERRWKEIDPLNDGEPRSWKVRLAPERGDHMAVWREMLVGYYLGKLTAAEIAGRIENQASFEATEFSKGEYPREGFLCEWKFYDALFQSVNGEPDTRGCRMREGLEQVLKTNMSAFDEYILAKNLITRIRNGEDLTPKCPSLDQNAN